MGEGEVDAVIDDAKSAGSQREAAEGAPNRGSSVARICGRAFGARASATRCCFFPWKSARAALAEIDACWGAAEEGDRLDVLLAFVEIYEAKRWPINVDDHFDPIDVLGYAIDELGHTQAELAEILGTGSRASEIPWRRRMLTVDMVQRPAGGGTSSKELSMPRASRHRLCNGIPGGGSRSQGGRGGLEAIGERLRNESV
ncbi:MAG: hypothetical protein J2P54_04875 [Bradyrhizobiaceae bacterium]|nr:hypothetical protein [Bradyrhizobiaceae bacterium]